MTFCPWKNSQVRQWLTQILNINLKRRIVAWLTTLNASKRCLLLSTIKPQNASNQEQKGVFLHIGLQKTRKLSACYHRSTGNYIYALMKGTFSTIMERKSVQRRFIGGLKSDKIYSTAQTCLKNGSTLVLHYQNIHYVHHLQYVC